MAKTDWNTHLDYLRESRRRWFNTDYLEFLIQKVWKLNKPTAVADFACGLGYMGEMLMPLLPAGSSYTGFDNADTLLEAARRDFADKPYKAGFIHKDLLCDEIDGQYDLVVCQALLLHLSTPEIVLEKMIRAAKPGGLVLCVDTNWNVVNAAMYIDGLDVDAYCNLGLLAKLWKYEKSTSGADRCIGMKLPVMLRRMGLSEVGIRLNDCVRFTDPLGDPEEYRQQILTLKGEGWFTPKTDESAFVKALCARGLSPEEARLQFACEKELNDYMITNEDRLFALTLPPMFISYGTKPKA